MQDSRDGVETERNFSSRNKKMKTKRSEKPGAHLKTFKDIEAISPP